MDRIRILALGFVDAAAMFAVVATAMQVNAVSQLLSERATLTQPYDVGEEGRFVG